MKTIEQSHGYSSLLPLDFVATESYDQLLQNAHTIAALNGVPTGVEETTFDLLDTLRTHDEKTAKECLQTLPLALQVGDILGNFYGIEPDYEPIWVASILHDIGKVVVPKTVIDRSNEGKIWTDRDRKIMRVHPFAGATIVRDRGFSEKVARPIEEHHHRQYGCPNYGRNPALSHGERMTRDCIAAADFTDAALHRTNTRNAHLPRSGREQEVIRHLHFLFEDYTEGNEAARMVAMGLLHDPIAA